jgi:hypothetical protein
MNFDLERNFHGVWDLLNDLNGVGLRNGHFDLLGYCNSLDVGFMTSSTGKRMIT